LDGENGGEARCGYGRVGGVDRLQVHKEERWSVASSLSTTLIEIKGQERETWIIVNNPQCRMRGWGQE